MPNNQAIEDLVTEIRRATIKLRDARYVLDESKNSLTGNSLSV